MTRPPSQAVQPLHTYRLFDVRSIPCVLLQLRPQTLPRRHRLVHKLQRGLQVLAQLRVLSLQGPDGIRVRWRGSERRG